MNGKEIKTALADIDARIKATEDKIKAAVQTLKTVEGEIKGAVEGLKSLEGEKQKVRELQARLARLKACQGPRAKLI